MLRDEILSAIDTPKPEPVEVPEWPCKRVFVRVMSGAELDSYESAIIKRNETGGTLTRTHMLVRCICDESGKREFKDSDAAALAEKNGLVLDRLWDAASRVNGRGAKATEQIVKNSESAPSDASGSN